MNALSQGVTNFWYGYLLIPQWTSPTGTPMNGAQTSKKQLRLSNFSQKDPKMIQNTEIMQKGNEKGFTKYLNLLYFFHNGA